MTEVTILMIPLTKTSALLHYDYSEYLGKALWMHNQRIESRQAKSKLATVV